jgi:hypothetical protein
MTKAALVPNWTISVFCCVGSRLLSAWPKHVASPLSSRRLAQPEPNPQTIAGTARVLVAAPNDAKLRIPWREDLIRKIHSRSAMLRRLPLL